MFHITEVMYVSAAYAESVQAVYITLSLFLLVLR